MRYNAKVKGLHFDSLFFASMAVCWCLGKQGDFKKLNILEQEEEGIGSFSRLHFAPFKDKIFSKILQETFFFMNYKETTKNYRPGSWQSSRKKFKL